MKRNFLSIMFTLLVILPILFAIIIGIINPSLLVLKIIFISMIIDFLLALGIYLYIKYK